MNPVEQTWMCGTNRFGPFSIIIMGGPGSRKGGDGIHNQWHFNVPAGSQCEQEAYTCPKYGCFR